MGKWSDMAARLERDAGDNRDDRDEIPSSAPISAPNVSNVPNVPGFIPAHVDGGLANLRAMPAPRISRPEVWPEIVADALRLVSEGWAERALALGWEPLQLWGCSPDIGGNLDLESLAVRLYGRRIVLLDERTAIMESGAGTHAVFTRRPMDGAVYLWDLGRKDRGQH